MSKFISSLDTLLINCEIELILKWSQNCVLTSKTTRQAIPAGDDPAAEPAVDSINAPSHLKFNIAHCQLYVPVVTLSAEYENRLYEELETGITITVTWNKYRSQVINKAATNNLNYLIDPAFKNEDRVFVLAFENEEDRSIFSKYYTPHVEIKDYIVIFDGRRPFYELPIKNKKETYKAITELTRNDDYTTGNLLDYEYFNTLYKLILIDLSKQRPDLENQQINFIGKLEQDATIFFIVEEKHQTDLEFSQNSLTVE